MNRPKFTEFLLIIFSLIGSLLFAEVALRTLPAIILQPKEVPLLDYGDTIGVDIRFAPPGQGGFFKPAFKGLVRGPFGEKKEWVNNKAGLRYKSEVTTIPQSGVLRILSLGDSFAAGYRMGQNETYSAILEKELLAQGLKTEVPIAQTEEPTSALYYFQEYGSKLSPNITILGVTLGNDLSQTLYYLGNKYAISENGTISHLNFQFSDYWRKELLAHKIPHECLTEERILPTITPENIEENFHSFSAILNNTYYKFEKSHFFKEPYPIASYLGGYKSNLFDASNGLGHYLSDPPKIISDSFVNFFRVLSAFERQTKECHSTLVVVLFPQRFQVQSGDWRSTAQAYGLKQSCFDLMKPNKTIKQFCAINSINYLDLTDVLKIEYEQRGQTLFLPWGDMHLNENGHRIAGENIARFLKTLISNSKY